MEDKSLHRPTQPERLGRFAVSHFAISVLGAFLAIAVGFLLLVLAVQSVAVMQVILIVCSLAGLAAYAAAGAVTARTYQWGKPKSVLEGFFAFLFPSLIAWAWGSLMLYCASLSGKEAWSLLSTLLTVNFFAALPSLVMVAASLLLGLLDGGLLNIIVCMLLVGGLPPLLFLLGSIWGSQKAARVKNPDNEQEGSDGTQ